MTEPKLKPCPFCGSTWLYVTTEHGWLDDSTVIFCNSCKAIVKLEENDQEGMTEETKRRAIEAWNRRVGGRVKNESVQGDGWQIL